MNIDRRKFLRIHGLILTVAGILFATMTVIGRLYNIGPFRFFKNNQQASIGFFEAYLLISVCGLFLLVGSIQENTKNWNRLAAVIHTPLLVTNLTYWDFYSEVGMETAGIVSTIAHMILICVESFFGFRKR